MTFMVFAKRRWAMAVAEAAGLDPKAAPGRDAVDLLVVGAKKAQRTVRATGSRAGLDDLDFVLMAARALPDNPAAAARIEQAGGDGQRELTCLCEAAIRFYRDQGRDLGAPRPGRMREPWHAPGR